LIAPVNCFTSLAEAICSKSTNSKSKRLMFDVNPLVARVCSERPKQHSFEPTDVKLSDLTASTAKPYEESPQAVALNSENQPKIRSFQPKFSTDHDVVAIDSTSIVLGYVPEGLVGAIRASVIIKPKGKKHYRKEQYGAYLVVITNYNKDALYASTRELSTCSSSIA